MIDRILVAGFDAGIAPLLCLTKADLASPDDLVAQYTPLGVPVRVTFPGADLDPLRAVLDGHRSVFVGHSGGGQVDAGQRPDPRGGPGDRGGQRGDRPGRHTRARLSPCDCRIPATPG